MSADTIHGILKTILERVLDDRIDEHLYLDPNDGLEYLALKAHNIHELAKEVEYKLSWLMVTQRKEKSGIESKKEAAENSIRILKGNREQRKGGILQIAEKGLQKVGFGFIMEVISGEPVSEELSTSSATATSNGRGNEKEDISLASIVENTVKTLHHEINALRQALDESRSDCDHFQLLASEQSQKIIKHELHIQELEEKESRLLQSVEKLTLGMKAVEEEATRWREACEMEVEAGKAVITELNQEVTLLREELGRVKADLGMAKSKLQLKEKLAASAMVAQAAADACLKLADSRSAGLQQRIEELTRQIEQEDNPGRKERESARKRFRYVC
ncbi:hypothetical protein ACP70R_017987 [Stipagrostis hirtigluma subsp. patula]